MDKFNKTEVFKPVQQIRGSDLLVGRRYPLENLAKCSTQFGEAVVATLIYNDVKARLFLPKVYAEALDETDLDSINKVPHSLIMTEKVANTYKYSLEKIQE